MIGMLVVSAGVAQEARRNIVFILSDDHRYDFMSFMDRAPDFLETPNLDRMAEGGAWLKNAFVSTSLCSPSRASILTGQYAHHHQVVDNQRPVPEGTVFYPEYLQKTGYRTAFIGKWHMGHENDEPRKGFDHWESFKGQGVYFDPLLNINGQRRRFSGYTTDVLTDRAIGWLEKEHRKPFCLCLSYKSVHYPFTPAPRHAERYEDAAIEYPETMADTERNYETQPHWVRERRFGIHGVDHMLTTNFDRDPVPDFDDFYHDYCEAVHGLDENIGRLLDLLHQRRMAESTIVFYMGDNGFHLGEHGFYDKRDAFETSIRVPMLVYAPGMIRPGTVVEQMVQNIDIAPTILEIAGVPQPQRPQPEMDGRSFLPLLLGKKVPWRDHILYEYYWEWNFPAVPTQFAIRTDRYKYIFYHGLWDRNSFHDLKTDPLERYNLINVPGHQEQIRTFQNQLFDELSASGGNEIPLLRPKGDPQYYDRNLRE